VTRTLFENARLLDPEATEPRPGRLLVARGRIEACLGPDEPAPGDARAVDLAGRALAPGFVDIHYHGATIFDAPGAPDASLRQDAASILRHGVTGFLPTTVTLAPEDLRQRVMGLAGALDGASAGSDPGAVPLGIHLEGPWISADAPGAQPRDGIRPYDGAEGRAVLDQAEGRVRMVTLAPEIPGADALVAELLRRGIVPAVGHTRATAEIAGDGFDRGIRHVTHLFNAMGGFHHREPGAIGAALADDRVTCDLICDGVHVHPAAVRTAARAKGERLLLITDRIEPPDGAVGQLGGDALAADGTVWRLPDGTLAGSRLGLDRAVANASAFGAMTQLEAVAAATLGPARLLGVEAEHGTLRPGARADLVVLDADGSVAETWLAGERVWAAPAPRAASA